MPAASDQGLGSEAALEGLLQHSKTQSDLLWRVAVDLFERDRDLLPVFMLIQASLGSAESVRLLAADLRFQDCLVTSPGFPPQFCHHGWSGIGGRKHPLSAAETLCAAAPGGEGGQPHKSRD